MDHVMELVRIALVPGIGGLLWLVWRAMDKAEKALELAAKVRADGDKNLADYKLEVARSYVHIDYLRDVERRLTEHLVRIEAKLDTHRPIVAAE